MFVYLYYLNLLVRMNLFIWFESLSQLSKWIKVWEISRGWMQTLKKGIYFINVASRLLNLFLIEYYLEKIRKDFLRNFYSYEPWKSSNFCLKFSRSTLICWTWIKIRSFFLQKSHRYIKFELRIEIYFEILRRYNVSVS